MFSHDPIDILGAELKYLVTKYLHRLDSKQTRLRWHKAQNTECYDFFMGDKIRIIDIKHSLDGLFI